VVVSGLDGQDGAEQNQESWHRKGIHRVININDAEGAGMVVDGAKGLRMMITPSGLLVESGRGWDESAVPTFRHAVGGVLGGSSA
jgi:hypothetical protein